MSEKQNDHYQPYPVEPEHDTPSLGDMAALAEDLPDRHRVRLLSLIDTDPETPIDYVDMHCWPASGNYAFSLRGRIQMKAVDVSDDPLWIPQFQSTLVQTLAEMSADFCDKRIVEADGPDEIIGPLYLELSDERWAEIHVLPPSKHQKSRVQVRTVDPYKFSLLRDYAVESTDSRVTRLEDMTQFAEILIAAQRSISEMCNDTNPNQWNYEFEPLPSTLHIPNRELIQEPRRSFDRIAGYDHVKDVLRDLALVCKYPDMAKQLGLRGGQSVILHGQQGVGKSSLANGLAEELGAELYAITPANIIDKWVGSSARNIDEMMDQLAERASEGHMVVAILDDFESIAGKFRDSDTERTSMLRTFKQRLSDIMNEYPTVFFVATTRDLHQVDSSIINSDGFVAIEVPRPNEQTRVGIISLKLSDIYAHAIERQDIRPDLPTLGIDTDISPSKLAEISEGLTGGDFDQIMNDIKRERLRNFMRDFRTGAEYQLPPISQSDIATRIQRIKVERDL